MSNNNVLYADAKYDVRCERVNVYIIYGILFRLYYYSIAETVCSVCSVENKLKIRNNNDDKKIYFICLRKCCICCTHITSNQYPVHRTPKRSHISTYSPFTTLNIFNKRAQNNKHVFQLFYLNGNWQLIFYSLSLFRIC